MSEIRKGGGRGRRRGREGRREKEEGLTRCRMAASNFQIVSTSSVEYPRVRMACRTLSNLYDHSTSISDGKKNTRDSIPGNEDSIPGIFRSQFHTSLLPCLM